MKRENYLFRCLLIAIIALKAFVVYASDSADLQSKADSKVVNYSYPKILPKDIITKVIINNENITVCKTSAGSFAAFSFEGDLEIQVELPLGNYKDLYIAPKSLGITPIINDNKVSFRLSQSANLALTIEGVPQLYIFANPLENKLPDINNSNVIYYRAGQVYEVGQLVLKENQTLYIEGGAVVRGSVFASGASNLRIAGYGVLDGSYYDSNNTHRSILFEACRNSVIEDIIMIEPSSWMVVLGVCEDIKVQNIKQLGYVSSSDGVDIVGSKRIKVLNSFLRNGDDCIAIKAFNMGRYNKYVTKDFSADVEDIEVRGCSVLSFRGGQAFEIGHELTTNSVKNIRFIDCDVLGVHEQGGVFGIHNSDGAVISNVLYEDIRVEHYYNKLVDLRIIKSRYFKGEKRGSANNILFKNIDVTVSIYNPGYSISLIGGYDAEHIIENVVFDNFKLNNVKVTNADQLDLHVKQAKKIVFK